MSPPPPIFTAIVSRNQNDDSRYDDYEDDVASMLTQPLMHYNDDDVDEYGDEYSQDEEHAIVKPAASSSSSNNNKPKDRSYRSTIFPGTMLTGTVVGFLVQIISLCAYGLVLLRWGDQEETDSSNSSSNTITSQTTATTVVEGILYAILSVLTQLDLCIYVFLWLAFTCTVTKTGMRLVRNQISGATGSSSSSYLPRRALFLVGISFLVGIVMGAFVAWTLTDFYLGFPVPFLPIAGTVLFDLFLCYIMVQCYDILGQNGEDDEDDDEEEGGAASVCAVGCC
jgi:magnesium-transporting ATPase (P-type)